MTTEGEQTGGTRRGYPGPRWSGDGALSRPTPRPQDDPTSPLHAPPPLPPLPASPPVAAQEPEVPLILGQPYASLTRRAAAYLVDVVLKVLLAEVILGLAGVPVSINPLDPAVFLPMEMLRRGYDLIFWTQGWTPGARLAGIRIVTEDGDPPGFGRAFRRMMCSIISEMAVFIGYAWMIWDPRRQTWHDKFAKTYVVVVDRNRRR